MEGIWSRPEVLLEGVSGLKVNGLFDIARCCRSTPAVGHSEGCEKPADPAGEAPDIAGGPMIRGVPFVVVGGHVLIIGLRRGHYEFGVEAAPNRPLAAAFDDLAPAI
ncbi:MAG: hypothetical protein M3256_25000 [Actinomycetota bacterium]|nr:hypothetical protein [Actinomycetota bacterium]